MTKRIIFFGLLAWALCSTDTVFGQGSLRRFAKVKWSGLIGGTVQKSFGLYPQYPINKASEIPSSYGIQVGVAYGGFGDAKNSLAAQFTYFLPTSTIDVGYGGATLSNKAMALELNYHRYIKGRYIDDAANLYAIGGFVGYMNTMDYTMPYPERIPLPEQQYFQDDKDLIVMANFGLGGEVPIKSVYLFGEIISGIHLNTYRNKTTVWESEFMYNLRGRLGLRIPIIPNNRPTR